MGISSVILNDLGFVPLIQDLIPCYNDWRAIVDYPFRDKVSHFFQTGIACLLLNFCLKGRKWKWRKIEIYWGTLLATVGATIEECTQALFKSRTFDLMDLGAALLGVYLMGTLAYPWLEKKFHSLFPKELQERDSQ